jgi:hypothetical protein
MGVVVTMGVDRRLYRDGVHVASLVPLPYEYPLSADYDEGGPRCVPTVPYRNADDTEDVLVAAYEKRRPDLATRKFSLAEWRDRVPYREKVVHV